MALCLAGLRLYLALCLLCLLGSLLTWLTWLPAYSAERKAYAAESKEKQREEGLNATLLTLLSAYLALCLLCLLGIDRLRHCRVDVDGNLCLRLLHLHHTHSKCRLNRPGILTSLVNLRVTL